MKSPPPLHYAVRMALENALEALDAGAAPCVPSGVVASLRLRRKMLREIADGFGPFRLKDAYELGDISRVLDALDRKVSDDAA